MSLPRILCINPGSTSTKVAVFEGPNELFSEDLRHPKEELAKFARVMDQMDYRRAAVAKAVAKHLGDRPGLAAISGRGGLLRALPGGVYAVSPAMLDDLAQRRHGEHPCNLGAALALDFGAEHGCPSYVVDPPVTDEMQEMARITGLPRIRRRSVFHALSQRAAARRAADMLGVNYEDSKFLVAHMGGGVSVGAHCRGRVVDVTNGVDGEGPMSAERAGALPCFALLDLVRQGADPRELRTEILTRGGLYAHTGTNDLREVEARMDAGDEAAILAFTAQAYSVAKYTGGMAATLFEEDEAPIAAVVLTGGMAKSPRLVAEIERRVRWIAPVIALPEVEEMRALALGAELALRGDSPVQQYHHDGILTQDANKYAQQHTD
jgi:butyrate kinase